MLSRKHAKLMTFQFTCPSRSTTKDYVYCDTDSIVSIHVPLAEHDIISSPYSLLKLPSSKMS